MCAVLQTVHLRIMKARSVAVASAVAWQQVVNVWGVGFCRCPPKSAGKNLPEVECKDRIKKREDSEDPLEISSFKTRANMNLR